MRRRLNFLREKLLQFNTDHSNLQTERGIQDISRSLALANEYVRILIQTSGRDIRLVEAYLCLANISELLTDRSGAQDHAIRAMVVAARAYGTNKDEVLRPAIEVLQRCYPYD